MKSARLLGESIGLSSRQMNYYLFVEGYLGGSPGCWFVTEKGKEYANERAEHRGPGGYPQYNRDWTITTWDDSILDALDTSEERLEEIRNAADEFYGKRRKSQQTAGYIAQEQPTAAETIESQDGDDNTWLAELLTPVFTAALGWVVYKTTDIVGPPIKKWWVESAQPKLESAKEAAFEFLDDINPF